MKLVRVGTLVKDTRTKQTTRTEELACTRTTVSGKSLEPCLFCWKVVPLKEENDKAGVSSSSSSSSYATYPDIVGATNSVLLRKQLCHWFILSNLLEVPRNFCEKKLVKADSRSNSDGGPGSWFQVCGECLNSLVAEAWQIHTQISKLKGRMNEIKAEIKNKILESCPPGRAKTKRNKKETSAMEIRKLVVPEIEHLMEVNVISTEEEHINPHDLEYEGSDIEIDIKEELEPQDLTPCIDETTDDIRFGDDISPGINHGDSKVLNNENWIIPNEQDEKDVEMDHIEEPKMSKKGTSKIIRVRRGEKTKRKPRKRTVREPRNKKARIAVEIGNQEDINSEEIIFNNPDSTIKTEGDVSQQSKEKKSVGVVRGKANKVRKYYKRKPYPKKISFPCNLCACLPFSTSEDLQLHLELHEERKNAKVKGQSDNALERLNCDQCSYPARDAVELMNHIRCRHDNPAKWKRNPQYPCPFCSKVNDRWIHMAHHVKTKHPSAPPDEVQAFFDRFLKCDLCGFEVTRPKDLFLHKRRHEMETAGPAPLKKEEVRRCEECKQIFVDEKSYRTHFANSHRRVGNFVCDVCGVGFTFQGKLDSHKVTHTKDLKRDWICHVCGVDFPRKGQLAAHCSAYHPEEIEGNDPTLKKDVSTPGKIYNCRYCDFTSPYNPVIRRHLQTHKQEGEHKCEQCGKFYMNAQGLRRHLRINHNESGEQVPCPHCLKPFASKEGMMTHVKKFCKVKLLSDIDGKTRT